MDDPRLPLSALTNDSGLRNLFEESLGFFFLAGAGPECAASTELVLCMESVDAEADAVATDVDDVADDVAAVDVSLTESDDALTNFTAVRSCTRARNSDTHSFRSLVSTVSSRMSAGGYKQPYSCTLMKH